MHTPLAKHLTFISRISCKVSIASPLLFTTIHDRECSNGLEIDDIPPPNTRFCPRLPALSVLELPTATYSWSPLLLASQMVGPPRLYVDYHNAQSLQPHHHSYNKSTRHSSPDTHQPQTSDRTVRREDIISGYQEASRRLSSHARYE